MCISMYIYIDIGTTRLSRGHGEPMTPINKNQYVKHVKSHKHKIHLTRVRKKHC